MTVRDGYHLIVASNGGPPDPPAWFRNIEADPEVEVRVKGDRSRSRARVATAEERPDMWKVMTAIWPD